MSIVSTISSIADWMNENVCEGVQLKRPTNDKQAMDDDYSYELVTPVAFPLFIPAKDRLPPNVKSEIPSVCVQILDGQSDVLAHTNDVNINLGFSCWNPGIHEKDIFFDGDIKDYNEFINHYFPTITDRVNKETKLSKFRRTATGWMDAWNFVDRTIRKLESIDNINGIQIVKSVPIKYGPFKDQDAIPDYYPFWFAWVQFTVREGVIRNNSYDNFL